jgi:hypothetical protein
MNDAVKEVITGMTDGELLKAVGKVKDLFRLYKESLENRHGRAKKE